MRILPAGKIYNIDPARATAAVRVPGAVIRQFLSGQTGGHRGGFEFMPFGRWRNESAWQPRGLNHFEYLHNRCMPNYVLHLGLARP